jgi:multidrug efflux system membrane fusion protein
MKTYLRLALPMVALLAGCSQESSTMQMPPVPVVVSQVVRKTVPFEVTSIGNVEAYRTVSVRSQVGGVLREIHFKEGDHVKKGQPLLLIDPAPYRAALEAAKATFARDQATAANLEQTVARYDELVKKNYITAQQHSDMLSQLASTKATVQADSAAVVSASLNLDYCSISSPIDGRIGEKLVDEGNVVKANSDNPLLVIHQIEPVFVRFTVPERYLTEILKRSGEQPLIVRAAAPEETPGVHKGKLTFIDNAVDRSTGTIMLKAEFANHDTMMWPGEFVNVVLVLKELPEAVVVPAQAIGTGQQGDYLFVLKSDATVELRPVTVQYRLNNDAVIERGVEPGERVVIDGQLRLRPGASVIVKPPVGAGETGDAGQDEAGEDQPAKTE